MLFSFNAAPISRFLGQARSLQSFPFKLLTRVEQTCNCVQLRAAESVLRSRVDDG